MNKLRFHFVIVGLCCFSFLLLAGTFIFQKEKIDFDAGKKPIVEAKDNRRGRLVNVEGFKKMSSPKNEVRLVEMEK
jgi:hypothetical protein